MDLLSTSYLVEEDNFVIMEKVEEEQEEEGEEKGVEKDEESMEAGTEGKVPKYQS